MSVGSNVVKLTAKTALKGNFLKVSIACLIFIFSCIITGNLAGLLSIVTEDIIAQILSIVMTLFLNLPIALGVVRYIWRMLFSVLLYQLNLLFEPYLIPFFTLLIIFYLALSYQSLHL